MIALLACAEPPPAPVDPPEPALPPHHVYSTVAEALEPILALHPKVLGVGELHATTDGPAIRSTMARFTKDFLPILAPHASDLILETWRLDGRCGPTEEVVATEIQTDTRRPEETKSELVLLAEAALAANVRPHDLALTCDEYASLAGPDGQIVYDTLLRLLTGKLQDFAMKGLETPDASLVLYGGAVHNDLTPAAEMAAWAYGPAVAARSAESYVELDLYVPELVTATLTEPAWAPLLTVTGPDRLILYERGPRSFVLLLESTPPAR